MYRHAFRVVHPGAKFGSADEDSQLNDLVLGGSFTAKREADAEVARLRGLKRDGLPVAVQYRTTKREANETLGKVEKTKERVAFQKSELLRVQQESVRIRENIAVEEATLADQQAKTKASGSRRRWPSSSGGSRRPQNPRRPLEPMAPGCLKPTRPTTWTRASSRRGRT